MATGRSFRTRITVFFVLFALAGLAAVMTGFYLGSLRLEGSEAGGAFVSGAVIASFALLALIVFAWFRFDENFVKPISSLTDALKVRAQTDVTTPIEYENVPLLGDLAEAANAVFDRLVEANKRLEDTIEHETRQVEQNRQRLEAILRDFPGGIVLCSVEHQIVLYNRRATELLEHADALGLHRSLFEVLREEAIRHAFERLERARTTDTAVDVICSTIDGAKMLHGQMRLILDPDSESASGYILTLHDITEHLATHSSRELLLKEIIDGIRRPAASLQTAISLLHDETEFDETQQRQLLDAMADEVEKLAERIADYGRRYDQTASSRWPTADVAASDVLESLQARFENSGRKLDVEGEPLLLQIDGFTVARLIGNLTEALIEKGIAKNPEISVSPDGRGAMIDITWDGPVLGIGQLENLLTAPLVEGQDGVDGKAVIESHGTDLWPDKAPDGRSRLRFPIREARPETEAQSNPVRAEFYDFDLFSASSPGVHDDRELKSLTYVVFDTEATGLEPARGDEIVQIAGVRIVNGRVLTGEVFDTLVNPGRSIPSSSTEIHGITESMVAEAPTAPEAVKRFHRFCSGAVLVAHNAPFDMALLRKHETATGRTFDFPVLDTVLLSAVLFGEDTSHTLDALVGRLGIDLPEALRHTAHGDAVATARAFLKMLPMLHEAGVGTLASAIARSRDCHGILRRQKDYGPAERP